MVAAKDHKVAIGPGDVVYLDRGQQQGVRLRDRFDAFLQGEFVPHPTAHRLVRLPHRVLGKLTVIDVRDHTSTAMITSSRRELSIGMPVELHVAPDQHPVEAKATEPDDPLSAPDLAQQAAATTPRAPETLKRYTVQRGDTLWSISAQPSIYHNPFMWPTLYQANHDHIRDPDLIFPAQTLAVPRLYTREAAEISIQRARQRGAWRLGDGPDASILQGVRR